MGLALQRYMQRLFVPLSYTYVLFRVESLSVFSLEKLRSSKLTIFAYGKYGLMAVHSSIDHHRSDPLFATASTIVQVWDETKCVIRYGGPHY